MDFQEVVGGWPPAVSWEPVSTWAFGFSKCILRKNLKQVIDHCPGFSSSATKPDPCTRIAAGTGRARLMGVGIYPAPLVFWGSCPVAPGLCPGHPLDSLGRAPSWSFPAGPGGWCPRTASRPGGGRSGRKSDFARGLALPCPWSRLPPSDLSRTNGHSQCILEKTTAVGDTSLGPLIPDGVIKPWCG